MKDEEKFHLIANAHLDPVWQWRVPEGLSLVKSTFRSALDRMNEFPDYTFTSACASYYKWIKLNEPEMFEEIKQRVKEGRWAIVGGMWVQPDCNIPSGEAFCRHMLYSQKFFKENFGFIVKTGYNVDSFGHNGMLPQLLKKSGIDNYIYQRPDNRTENLIFRLMICIIGKALTEVLSMLSVFLTDTAEMFTSSALLTTITTKISR